MHEEHRRKHNEEFIRRLIARRPELREKLEPLLSRRVEEAPGMALESLEIGAPPEPAFEIALETIVNDERPVLFVVDDRLDTNQVTIKGIEAQDLVDKMKTADAWLRNFMPLVGRVDVSNFPGEYVGTGWFVDENIVVTNRHVASLIARHDGRKFVFKLGVGNRPINADVNTTHEFDDAGFDASRNFKVDEVLYIEPDSGPNDIAFLKVRRRASGVVPKSIPVARTDVGAERLVCAIGYPARASRRVIPDQQLMNDLYLGRFDIKRAAPGFTMPMAGGTTRHDCTTLGGNSGSVVIDLQTKEAVGLHFAGLYQETNFAVRASVLRQYIDTKRWNQPLVLRTRTTTPRHEDAASNAQPQSVVTSADAGVVQITVPLEISLRLGAPVTGPITATVTSSAKKDPEAVAIELWRNRPEGVTGVRVGYEETEDGISDVPFISVSAPASRLAEVEAAGPKQMGGLAVRYEAADVLEQLESEAVVEAATSISYDDDARTGKEFSFAAVTENMEMLLHVGPEYSWDTLHAFLDEAKGHLVSAMYEFHAVSVKDALEERLNDKGSLTLVLDGATFVPVKNEEEEIDAEAVFNGWQDDFGKRFEVVTVPEGANGLIANAYHIKVTVRDDDTFWLSSGNWKMKSSQPVITEDDRLNIDEQDLPGNREWHVIVKNKTLADRFRAHIQQDFARSRKLIGEGAPESPFAEVMVDVPMDGFVLERKKPSRLLEPKTIEGKFKVQPLLTPDDEGGVYTRAVVSLIQSAKKSLLFQIPYIKAPSKPGEHRGNIDDLLDALIDKLKTLDDGRVIISGGSDLSSPAHVAWYFKQKGVDIDNCLKTMDKHHTKGMVVDGKRVLIGSHNWSPDGVTLNRDASLIIHAADAANYYAEAFEIDWERANKVAPKKFVKKPKPVHEAVGAEAPEGYVRVPLKEVLSDD